jgi:hypothetical protein
MWPMATFGGCCFGVACYADAMSEELKPADEVAALMLLRITQDIDGEWGFAIFDGVADVGVSSNVDEAHATEKSDRMRGILARLIERSRAEGRAAGIAEERARVAAEAAAVNARRDRDLLLREIEQQHKIAAVAPITSECRAEAWRAIHRLERELTEFGASDNACAELRLLGIDPATGEHQSSQAAPSK